MPCVLHPTHSNHVVLQHQLNSLIIISESSNSQATSTFAILDIASIKYVLIAHGSVNSLCIMYACRIANLRAYRVEGNVRFIRLNTVIDMQQFNPPSK
jgi:hypothetical protein